MSLGMKLDLMTSMPNGMSHSPQNATLACSSRPRTRSRAPGTTGRVAGTIARPAFERAKADVAGTIRVNRRLPADVWIGSEKLSIADFAATLAADDGASAAVTLRKGNLEMEKYVSTDAKGTFSWPIHPEGFSAPQLLELARLQAWTLKPARLK